MGKIHKALEKSKKEQQQLQKDPFGSLKPQVKDSRRSVDIPSKVRDKTDYNAATESKLSTIHALLDDKVKMKPVEREAQSFKEKKHRGRTWRW